MQSFLKESSHKICLILWSLTLLGHGCATTYQLYPLHSKPAMAFSWQIWRSGAHAAPETPGSGGLSLLSVHHAMVTGQLQGLRGKEKNITEVATT